MLIGVVRLGGTGGVRRGRWRGAHSALSTVEMPRLPYSVAHTWRDPQPRAILTPPGPTPARPTPPYNENNSQVFFTGSQFESSLSPPCSKCDVYINPANPCSAHPTLLLIITLATNSVNRVSQHLSE
ncbi:hypothetical protein NL676_022347 [Syzygium grande]|nr:hypothetical protein NL676_022347 [Syzygium grande]